MNTSVKVILFLIIYVLIAAIILRICSANTRSLSPEQQRLEDDAQYAWVCEQNKIKIEQQELKKKNNKRGRRN